jgi:hypothetical protein
MGIVMLACSTGWTQINEKDTLAATLFSKNGSVFLQASVLPDYVDLRWTKGPHELISYFELYRSADGVAYHLVRQFHPQSFDAADDSYEYRDTDPLRGRNFYRLVGYQRGTTDKRTVDLVADYHNQPRKLGPTLVSKGAHLYLENYDGSELYLWIFNATGTPLVKRVVNSSSIPVPENVGRGMYVYQLLDRQKVVVSNGKFVIQ